MSQDQQPLFQELTSQDQSSLAKQLPPSLSLLDHHHGHTAIFPSSHHKNLWRQYKWIPKACLWKLLKIGCVENKGGNNVSSSMGEEDPVEPNITEIYGREEKYWKLTKSSWVRMKQSPKVFPRPASYGGFKDLILNYLALLPPRGNLGGLMTLTNTVWCKGCYVTSEVSRRL